MKKIIEKIEDLIGRAYQLAGDDTNDENEEIELLNILGIDVPDLLERLKKNKS